MARPIAKDYEFKRDHILNSAARLFAKEGFAGASMSALAQECKISKANIYHYYSGKDALLFDLLDSYLKTLHQKLTSLKLDGAPPKQKFFLLVREILLAYQGMDYQHQVQLNEMQHLPKAQQDILRSYQRDMISILRNVISEIAPVVAAQDKSKLHAVTMSVFAMLNWFYMWNRQEGTEARENYAQVVTDLTLGGIIFDH
tara:strand:- start:179 stop:778 length:600 start_codon:yes stop_codon:yes gene_type:complete